MEAGWLLGGNSPLTRADLDPISNGHAVFIENLSMHIYYVNSKAFEIAGITDKTDIAGIVKEGGKPTGEVKEIEAALAFVAKLPPLDCGGWREWRSSRLQARPRAGTPTVSRAVRY
jgi:predicted amidohydrolase YtcJ